MANHRRYDDKFRASAVVMLQAAGYPEQKGALTHVAEHIGVPVMTLRGWYTMQSNPPPTDIRNEKKEELANVFERAAYIYLNHALKAEVVAEVSGNAAMMTAAVATDKMRLLRDLPTEIISIMPPLVKALEAAGLKPSDVFDSMLRELAQNDGTGSATVDSGDAGASGAGGRAGEA